MLPGWITLFKVQHNCVEKTLLCNLLALFITLVITQWESDTAASADIIFGMSGIIIIIIILICFYSSDLVQFLCLT